MRTHGQPTKSEPVESWQVYVGSACTCAYVRMTVLHWGDFFGVIALRVLFEGMLWGCLIALVYFDCFGDCLLWGVYV